MKGRSAGGVHAYRAVHAGSGILDIVVSLYDCIIVDLMQAQEARVTQQFDREFMCLQSASHRLLGLRSALDEDRGGALVKRLDVFYATASYHISAIPRRPDPVSASNRLLRQMRAMRAAWSQVASGQTPVLKLHSAHDSGIRPVKDLNVVL